MVVLLVCCSKSAYLYFKVSVFALACERSYLFHKVSEIFDMRPAAIEDRLKLRNPIYRETAAYGHMGKEPRIATKVFESPYNGRITKEVELFTWEKLDYVDKVKEAISLNN